MAKAAGTTTKKSTAVSHAATASGTPVSGPPPAGSDHQAIVAIGLMLLFVFIMTMVAGIGPRSGRVAVGVMVILTVAQAVTHVNPFVTWASNHPLTPTGTGGAGAFTVSGLQ